MADRFTFERLANHSRSDFSSGDSALDAYLKRQAGQDQRRHVATCFVLVDAGSQRVVGYYTLSASSLDFEALPNAVSQRLPRYPLVPAVLLGRMAVDARYQGQGFGRRLLVHALLQALGITPQVAAYAMIVDAKSDESAQFYERFGFERLGKESLRLFLPMATIARLATNQPS